MGTERIGTDDPISGTNPRDGGDLAADFLENETIHATAGKCCNQAIALMKVRFRLAPSALPSPQCYDFRPDRIPCELGAPSPPPWQL
jgi:hypothetical protein